MKTILSLIASLMAASLSGCTATMVQARNDSNKSVYAPVNEVHGGTVKYLNNGAYAVKESRRNNAYKKMYQSCGGDYRIIREYSISAGTVGGYLPNAFYAASSDYLNIDFECVNKGAL